MKLKDKGLSPPFTSLRPNYIYMSHIHRSRSFLCRSHWPKHWFSHEKNVDCVVCAVTIRMQEERLRTTKKKSSAAAQWVKRENEKGKETTTTKMYYNQSQRRKFILIEDVKKKSRDFRLCRAHWMISFRCLFIPLWFDVYNFSLFFFSYTLGREPSKKKNKILGIWKRWKNSLFFWVYKNTSLFNTLHTIPKKREKFN